MSTFKVLFFSEKILQVTVTQLYKITEQSSLERDGTSSVEWKRADVT